MCCPSRAPRAEMDVGGTPRRPHEGRFLNSPNPPRLSCGKLGDVGPGVEARRSLQNTPVLVEQPRQVRRARKESRSSARRPAAAHRLDAAHWLMWSARNRCVTRARTAERAPGRGEAMRQPVIAQVLEAPSEMSALDHAGQDAIEQNSPSCTAASRSRPRRSDVGMAPQMARSPRGLLPRIRRSVLGE